MTQYYNSANQPADVSVTQLMNTQATWSKGSWTAPVAASSSFRFSYGGTTKRCPSLVQECKGRQKCDAKNDVAWMVLRDPNTLGVTWSGTSTDEADIAVNTNFKWFVDGVKHFDVETVLLHENGHAMGLGHSNDITALMYPSYQGVLRTLTADEIAGVSTKDPAPGPVALAVTSTSLADGIAGSSYGVTLTASGGTAPYSWAITAGALPAGLSLIGDTISGIPTTVETANFTIQVTDSADPADTASATVSIAVADAGSTVGVSAFSYSTAGGKNSDKNLRVTQRRQRPRGCGGRCLRVNNAQQ